MSMKIPIARRSHCAVWLLAIAVMAIAAPGVPILLAQEPASKTVGEHIKEYWDKLISKSESAAKASGEEYHKLKERAAKASGPARAKLAAEMEALGKKWSETQARLAAGIELRMHTLSEEIATLEEKAKEASGPSRAKMDAEVAKLRSEWEVARRKMGATLDSGLKASQEQFRHLQEQAAGATTEARAALKPRMERLAAEWRKDRERLTAFLEADLERTKVEMKKLGAETSAAAHRAREAMERKSHELTAKIKELTKESAPDDETK